MELGYNKFQGPCPSELCYLLNLGRLSLSSNLLSGRLPSCIGNITSLRYLYLDSNNLSFNLPSNLWRLRDILELNLSTNSFSGSFSSENENLKALITVDLSVNNFFGDIPTAIGGLQSLQALSLKHNRLQGFIPESMKNMLELQYLDLSFNNLTGEIPNSREVLQNLVYFNVSFNRFRGPIPHGGPFANFTKLSFLSNEALCDAPWLQPCQTLEQSSRKKTVLFVLLALGSAVVAMVVSFLVIRKWRRKIMSPSNLDPDTTFERVSFHELRQITNGFSESALLGSGTFGSVYKGIRENGMTWAIKVFDLQLDGAFKSFNRECEVLRCLRHRNLTMVISACSNPDLKALILEYMPNGSLEKRLYSGTHILNIMQRLDIMIDVACGLEYLHYGYPTPVIHCDLKPSNILLDQDMVGHVCDFGIAKLLGDGESVVQTKTLATFGYIAPVHLQDEPVKNKIACISSILELALCCTADASKDRMTMNDVLKHSRRLNFNSLGLKPLKQVAF
nr:receptor kinase-like protein Xa21 [Coffea arabica]